MMEMKIMTSGRFNWCKSCSIAYGGGEHPKYPRGEWPCTICADNCMLKKDYLGYYSHYYTTKPLPAYELFNDFVFEVKEENARMIQQTICDNYYRYIADEIIKGE